MCNTVQNVSHCETDIRKFDGFDAFCAYLFLVHMYMYLQANKLGVLRNVFMHTRMYFWQTKILSLVSLTLYSMRFIWNQIYFDPKYQRPYRIPPGKRELLRTQLNEFLSQGFSLLMKQIVWLLLALFFWLLSANPIDLMLPRVRRLTLLYKGFVVI